MPRTSSADAATRAALDLIEAIENPHPATPFPNIGNAQMSALKTLSDIFHQALQPAPTTLPKPKMPPPGRPLQAPARFPTVQPNQQHGGPTLNPAPAPRVPFAQ
eukprot:2915577-Ditylum_brightwellii.AAC.1